MLCSRPFMLLLGALALLLIAGMWLASNLPLGADEGTHLTLSLFYRDLLTVAPQLGWNAQSLYQFGIAYLVHYPKLTITYLPFYHLTLAPLLLLSTTVMTGRALSLLYMVMTGLLVYWTGRRWFGGPRAGLLAALLFISLPMAWWGAFRVSIDWAAYFLSFASIGAYLYAIEHNRQPYRWYAIAAVIAYLALLSRIFAVFPIVAMMLHAAAWGPRPRLPRLLSLAIPFAVLAIPTLVVFNYFGGLEASSFVTTEAATAPWSVTGPLAPFYYIWIYPLETAGIGLAVIAAALLALRDKQNNTDLFLLAWLAISYVALTPFQNHRYAAFILMPIVLFAARWFAALPKARSPLVGVLVAILIIIPVWNAYAEAESGREQLAAEKQLAAFIEGNPGNIGVLAEEPIYSSVYIWYAAAADVNKSYSVYRPCFCTAFNSSTLANEIKANGINTIIATRGGPNYGIVAQLTSNRPLMEVAVGNETIEVYSIGNVTQTQSCNHICLTGRYMCTDLSSPFELVRSSGTATSSSP